MIKEAEAPPPTRWCRRWCARGEFRRPTGEAQSVELTSANSSLEWCRSCPKAALTVHACVCRKA